MTRDLVFGCAFGREVISIDMRAFFAVIDTSSSSAGSLGRFFRPILGCCGLLLLPGLIATLFLVLDLVVRPSLLREDRVRGDAIDLNWIVGHDLRGQIDDFTVSFR